MLLSVTLLRPYSTAVKWTQCTLIWWKLLTVCHQLLLLKLHKKGLCDFCRKWFNSYLSNRVNLVKFFYKFSSPFTSLSGVPPGSNLGPLLFLVFVNDLLCSEIESQTLMFADDLKLFWRLDFINDCYKLQEDSSFIHQRCVTNRLEINVKKMSAVSFTRRRVQRNFNYTLSGDSILCVLDVHDPGAYVDSRLDFRLHVSCTVSRAMRHLGLISRLIKKFWHILRILFCVLVRTIRVCFYCVESY